MIAFDVGSVEAGKTLVNNVRICTLATSLGGVETILQHSASMTHAALPAEKRLKESFEKAMDALDRRIKEHGYPPDFRH